MAHLDFYIYGDRRTLQTPSAYEYRVHNVLKSKELRPAIKECKEELEYEGTHAIFKNFDKLYWVIEFIDQLDYINLHYVYDEILVKSLNIIGSYFLSYGNIEDIPPDLKRQFTNIIKMTVYLFIEFVESFNTKIETDYKLVLLETKGRNKMQDMVQKHTSDYDWNWDAKLSDGLNAIYGIMLHETTQLYDPPLIDHTFISYLACFCYKLLENPSIAFVRSKPLRDSIMQILSLLITNYDHIDYFKSKVVKLLKLFEHLALPLANTVLQIVVSGKNWHSLIELIVKEIAMLGQLDGIKETSSLEVNFGKSCCTFLVEIAKNCPQHVLPNIDNMLPCLESDPYTMRICVLSVLKELIIHVLNSGELNKSDQKTRDEYLSIIQDHTMDVNAFVRSKALNLLTSIINVECLPKHMYKVILNCAEEKLLDKSSYVTKSAIQLIKTLIKLNPYSVNFSENNLHDNLKEEKNNLKILEEVLQNKMLCETDKVEIWSSIESPLKQFLDEYFKNDSWECKNPEVIQDMEICDVIMKIKKLITLHKFDLVIKWIVNGRETFKDEPLFETQDNNDLPEHFFLLLEKIWSYENIKTSSILNDTEKFNQMSVEELIHTMNFTDSKIEYLQECAEYSHTIKKSLNIINKLMFGNAVSESLEAIDFFTTAYLFGVPHTKVGIDDMVILIYSSDSNIKEAVMNSYKTIYCNVEDCKDSVTRATIIMTKLIILVKTFDATHRKAFKVLIHEWIKNKTLDCECITILWTWFTKAKIIAHEDRIVAALLLSMIASANPSIVRGNLNILIEHGLCEDYDLFVLTCQILEQIENDEYPRFSSYHEITKRVINVIQKSFNNCDIHTFNDVALNAINAIYKLTSKPDGTCMALIKIFYKSIKKKKIDTPEQMNQNIELDVNSLTKFIFVIGHVALQQCYHLENYVSQELVRLVKYKHQLLKEKSDKPISDECMYDAEANETERVNNHIQNVCNKQLVTGSGVLTIFSNHILEACYSSHSELKHYATITLIKYMLVSTIFCQNHMPVFLNLIENSDSSEVCIDLVSGFGWLIFKHPNLLEPHTDKLYAQLKNKCAIVRYSTLLVIINLIRQEMIKVRGQIAGVARLIVDEDELTKNTARHFFGVLAGRGNTLYNVISDIISLLSNPEDLVPENDFQTIMKFLLPLITKERQIESLVDKLCLRLRESKSDDQAYYISYCLMIIKYSDKSLIKLSNNINYYTDKLKNPKVYNNFNILISTNSRMLKPATKDVVAELTSKIEKIVEDEGFTVATLSHKTPGKRLTTTKKKPPKSTKKECPEDDAEALQVVTKRSARCRSNVKRRLIKIDSEEEENSQEFAQTQGVSNIPKLINNSKNCESDHDSDKVFKKSTKQNISGSTSKRKLRPRL